MTEHNQASSALRVIAIPVGMVLLSIAICAFGGESLSWAGTALFFLAWFAVIVMYIWERGKRIHPRGG